MMMSKTAVVLLNLDRHDSINAVQLLSKIFFNEHNKQYCKSADKIWMDNYGVMKGISHS